MSTQQKYNKQRSENTSEKKYCGVCHKAGKSEKEYTNHFTKSSPGPSGVVICPTILTNHCRRCNGYGHFSDHCKGAKDQAKDTRPRAFDTRPRAFDTRPRDSIPEKKPEMVYEEMFPAIGQVTGTKRPRDGNIFAALENEAMPKAKPVAHKMNFKKMLETEYVAPKEEERFTGEMQVLNCKNFKVLTGSVPTPQVEPQAYDEEYDWEDEDEWEREDYEAEIERRLEERYEEDNYYDNYYEDEVDNSAW